VTAASLQLENPGNGLLRVVLSGDWRLGEDLPGVDAVLDGLCREPKPTAVSFDTGELGDWDTGLVTLLMAIHRSAEAGGIDIDETGLPEGARRLVAMTQAVKVREDARRGVVDKGLVETIGERTLESYGHARELLSFTGELVLSIRRFLTGRATYLKSDLVQHIQEAGAEALPIVSLISFLIGMIFAFVGVKQLELFGAGIYTANLVAVAMVREMSPIMTAIIMAGRTGAAYAAQIGTMKVNEEIDALETLGIEPMDFLVTPRVFALILMMPLLTMYASVMGVFGGMVVALVMLDINLVQYIDQSINAVGLDTLFGGLFKSVVYGTLVAMAGCQQGMICGSSAMAVGQVTTRAVVMSIVLIVVSASVLTIIYINLGI